MKFPSWLKVYGDVDFKGKCPKESIEQTTFFNWLKRDYPEFAKIALHVRNEGNFSHAQITKYKSEGMCAGASDIIIPAKITFVCEMKRQNHRLSQWQDDQIEFLEQSHNKGAFTCVALGKDGAKKAFLEWKSLLTY